MATPRYKLIDPTRPLHYHLISRCVRRAWLCGVDPVSGNDYSHRKGWLEQRLDHLAKNFAVSIDAKDENIKEYFYSVRNLAKYVASRQESR